MADMPVENELNREICDFRTKEADLFRNNPVFRAISSNIKDFIILWDNDFRIVYASPAIENLAGYRIEDFINWQLTEKTITDFVPPEYAELVDAKAETIRQITNGATPEKTIPPWEMQAFSKDGSLLWVETRLDFLKDESQNICGFITISRDISQCKQVENSLRESEEKYRSLVENINDVAFSVDPSGRINYLSPTIKTVSGYSPEELVGHSFLDHIHPDDIDEITHRFNMAMKGDLQFICEFRIITRSGAAIHVRTSSRLRYDSYRIAGINGILSDITEQVHSRLALEKSEAQFRELVENINDASFSINAAGYIKYISPVIRNIAGYSPEEVLGSSYEDFIFADDLPGFTEDFIKAVNEGVFFPEYIFRIVHKNGHIIHIRSSNRFILKNGKIIGINGILTDITDQVKARHDLEESEKKYRNLIENINDATYAVNIEGVFTFMSPICKSISGYDPEEITGTHLSRFVHPDDYQALAQHIATAFETGNYPPVYEFRGIHKNGNIVYLRTSSRVIYDENNQPVGINGIMADITEFKEAEEKIQQGEKRYQLLAGNVQDVIWTMDPHMHYTYLSPSQEKLLGYRKKETLDLPLEQTMTSESYRRFKALFDRYAQIPIKDSSCAPIDESEVIELEMLTKDGSSIWTESKLSFLYNASGKLYEVVGITRDISDRRLAENALRRAKEETDAINRELEDSINRVNKLAADAEMANIAKSEFLANMSHEIRTPMNGVIGMVELLMNSQLSPEQQRYAETAQRSGEALLTIVNDILDFSKIEAGKMEIENIDFDLRQTMEDISDIVAFRAHEKGLELSCIVEHNVPSLLQGDPSRIRQVILNLVGNAIKFTSRGEVIIRVTLAAETDKQAIIRFSVSDTGIGIRKKKLTSLFGPFTQEDASITRKYGGTGLGLAISKRLTEMMGGKIGVESTEGKGATFWFTILLNKQPKGRKPREVASGNIRNHRILIVDDNATNRSILKDHLTQWGALPRDAADADEALAILRQACKDGHPFSLAIIDMQMPGMDGETLGKEILADPDLKNTVMVMITSADRPGEAAHMKSVGFADYISKPVKRSVLAESLSRALGGGLAAEKPISSCPIPVSRQNLKTLIVEDNEVNQAVACGILDKLGYHYTITANGKEAVEALSKNDEYDLVLMDLQMPEMDGFEATRIIRDPRSKVKRHDIAIIAMTAHALKQDRARCLDAGMDDYVAKPFRPEEIDEAIRRQISIDDTSAPPQKTAAPDKPTTDLKLFDRTAFLERINGNVDLMQRVIKVYIEKTPEQLQELKEALRDGDAARIRLLGHAVKGASANIEAPLLKETAYKIECAGKSADLSEVEPLISSFEEIFSRLKATVDQEI